MVISFQFKKIQEYGYQFSVISFQFKKIQEYGYQTTDYRLRKYKISRPIGQSPSQEKY